MLHLAKNLIILFLLFWCNFTSLGDEKQGVSEEEAEQFTMEEEEELDLNVFNADYVQQLDDALSLKALTTVEARSLLSKLGKIALFIRIYRSWVYSPTTGHRGFYRYFPQPSVQFHSHIYGNCTQKANGNSNGQPDWIALFKNCVAVIFDNIQQRAKFMFPVKGQRFTFGQDDFYHINEEDFTQRVSNTKFSFDMSVSYLFCFLVKNKLSILARLPFCGYGFEPHQNPIWPSYGFRQYAYSPEFWPSETQPIVELDPIDDFMNQFEFECADVSFCPDPCCGRNSTRFLREFNASVPAKTDFGWCTHSTCTMNIRHLDEEIARKYFREKQLVENYTKGLEGENQQLENATVRQDILQSDDVNTHYCYLEEPFNDDFIGIMENRWNLSCACAFLNGTLDPFKIYRFDVRECVDLDECIFEECSEPRKCVNTVDGFKCACPLGQYTAEPEKENGQCSQIKTGDHTGLPENLFS